MTSLDKILILAGVPLAILVLLGLLTLWPNFVRVRPHRPGQEWEHPPVLWTADPEALRDASVGRRSGPVSGAARGGASGNW